jgi:hypothetical protein
MHASRSARLFLVVTATVALVAGCSAPGASPAAANPSLAANASPAAGITVTDGWGRTSSAMASAEAVYATITNAGSTADALVGASSPAARTVEVHETVVIGSPMPSASGEMGTASTMPSASGGTMMGMRPVARVEIAPGGSLQLKPGSYHVMLIGLVKDLKAGDTIDVTFMFEKAGPITFKAQIRES